MSHYPTGREAHDREYGEGHEDNWMQTASGRRFYIFRPTADMVHVEDIAAQCGNLCRFTGAVRKFYSVAQHCVLVSHLVPAEHALWGLFHDASEAYVNDINRPTKRGLPQYREMEQRILVAICDRFGLPREEPPCVKDADRMMLAIEARDLMPNPTLWSLAYGEIQPIQGIKIDPLPPEEAARAFLNRYYQLTNEA